MRVTKNRLSSQKQDYKKYRTSPLKLFARSGFVRLMNKLKSYPLVIIFLLLLLSVLIRWPAFTKSVPGSHVWLSAHVVMTTQIWKSEGIATYGFNPVYTFPSTPNKYMRSLASGMHDSAGNFYYVSYPPFSFYLAYLFFTILFLKPSITGLYILNIIIHGITSILIYILVCKTYRKKITGGTYIPALLAASLYIFSTQTLWCHVYMYFADSLIQLLWVSYILISFIIFKRKGIYDWQILVSFSIISFLISYTEWLGLFASFILLIYASYRSFKEPAFIRVILLSILTTLLALGITVIQYSSIDGFASFVNTSLAKYSDRNGYITDGFYFTKINFLRLLSHYWRSPKANIILIAGFLLLYAISKKKADHLKSDYFFLLMMTLLPILLHHAAFLQFSSMHDFSTLKSSVLFCILIPLFYNSIDFAEDQRVTLIDKKQILFTLFFIMILLNIALFYSLNTSSSLQQKAYTISNSSKPDQSLFAITNGDQTNGVMVFMGRDRGFSTQIQLFTQRNILAVPERKDVIEYLATFHKQEGKVYFFDFYGNLVGIETIKMGNSPMPQF